jgi:hypothetical protein
MGSHRLGKKGGMSNSGFGHASAVVTVTAANGDDNTGIYTLDGTVGHTLRPQEPDGLRLFWEAQ